MCNNHIRCYKIQKVYSRSCLFDYLIYLKMKEINPNRICFLAAVKFFSDLVTFRFYCILVNDKKEALLCVKNILDIICSCSMT